MPRALRSVPRAARTSDRRAPRKPASPNLNPSRRAGRSFSPNARQSAPSNVCPPSSQRLPPDLRNSSTYLLQARSARLSALISAPAPAPVLPQPLPMWEAPPTLQFQCKHAVVDPALQPLPDPTPLALGGKPLTLLSVQHRRPWAKSHCLSLPPSHPTAALLRRPAPASPSSAGPHRPRPPPPARTGPRRPSSLLSPCRAHAHLCQRADNVLFWPAVTLPSFSLRRPPRRRRSPSPPRSVAFPVAAAPHPRQGQLPSPSPPLPVAAKVSCPPRHHRSPSPPRSVALPIAAAPRRRRSPSPPLSRLRPSVKNIVRVVVKNIVLWPSQQRRGRARRGRPKRCSTTFFSKTREMRSLTRCRRRQRGLYADGAPHNGLREVDDARSSGLQASKVEG